MEKLLSNVKLASVYTYHINLDVWPKLETLDSYAV